MICVMSQDYYLFYSVKVMVWVVAVDSSVYFLSFVIDVLLVLIAGHNTFIEK